MTSDSRTFRTTRTLPYLPDKIYFAFESPELLAAWWGPEGFTNTFETFEFKVAGQWKFIMHGPDGSNYSNENVFLALEPGRRVVIRHECLPYFTLTVLLDEDAAGTKLTWEQAFDDAVTAQAVQHIVVPANEQNLDRMTRALAGSNAA